MQFRGGTRNRPKPHVLLERVFHQFSVVLLCVGFYGIVKILIAIETKKNQLWHRPTREAAAFKIERLEQQLLFWEIWIVIFCRVGITGGTGFYYAVFKAFFPGKKQQL